MTATKVLDPGHYFLAYTSNLDVNRVRILDESNNTSVILDQNWVGYEAYPGINIDSATPTLEFDVPDDGNHYKALLYASAAGQISAQAVHATNFYCLRLS